MLGVGAVFLLSLLSAREKAKRKAIDKYVYKQTIKIVLKLYSAYGDQTCGAKQATQNRMDMGWGDGTRSPPLSGAWRTGIRGPILAR